MIRCLMWNCSQVAHFHCGGIIMLKLIFIMFWLIGLNDTGPGEFAALWSCLGHWRVSCSYYCLSLLLVIFTFVVDYEG